MNREIDTIIEFDTLKHTILNMIANADMVISQKNSSQEAGIYLLYVDNFQDERIIPFYIGKTVNFQKRFRDHIKDLKALMEFRYAEYHNKFFWSAVSNKRFFEGKYRPCKIFKYIIDHDCSIDDVKMIVLETCDCEQLEDKELHYLSTFLPAYFGFNQIATITEQFVYRNDPEKRDLIIKHDFQCFQKYIEYGYSTFNYLHCFTRCGNIELDKKINQLLSNHLWQPQEKLLSDAITAFKNYQNIYQDVYEKISDIYGRKIHDIFEKCRIKSKGREADVLSVFTNHYRTLVVDDVNSKLEYLEYYFNRDKKSRECGKLIKDLYNTYAEDINRITAPVLTAFESYISSRDRAIKQSEYSIIFPQKQF